MLSCMYIPFSFFCFVFLEKEMLQKGLAVTENGVKSPIPSKFIIHVDLNGKNYKKKILEALNKVEELKLKTVALPALGTGVIFSSNSYEHCSYFKI